MNATWVDVVTAVGAFTESDHRAEWEASLVVLKSLALTPGHVLADKVRQRRIQTEHFVTTVTYNLSTRITPQKELGQEGFPEYERGHIRV